MLCSVPSHSPRGKRADPDQDDVSTFRVPTFAFARETNDQPAKMQIAGPHSRETGQSMSMRLSRFVPWLGFRVSGATEHPWRSSERHARGRQHIPGGGKDSGAKDFPGLVPRYSAKKGNTEPEPEHKKTECYLT
jgi:hypothetical protein